MKPIPIVCSRIWLAEFFAKRNGLKKSDIRPVVRGDQLRGFHPPLIIVLHGWDAHKSFSERMDIRELIAYHEDGGTKIVRMSDLDEIPVEIKKELAKDR